MSWSFRRSIRLGPLRFNLSKSGVGTSVGVRGFRVGKNAKGRDYSQISIPGTGIYRRDYSNSPSQLGITSQKYVVIAIAILLALLWAILR